MSVSSINKMRSKTLLSSILVYLILLLGSFIMLLPFLWMISSSFKPSVELLRMPPTWIPNQFTLNNFRLVLDMIPFQYYLMNSIFVSTVNTAVALVGCSLTGYIFAKYKFFGRDVLFMIVLGGMMIPFQVIMIPMYKLMIDFNWVNSYLALTIPYFYNIFGIFLMRQFMVKFPDELVDAATIDGCGHFAVFIKIVVPLVKSALAALGIFLFMATWNDYLWPLIVIDSDRLSTLPLGLGSFVHQRGTRYDLLMAASLMTVLPLLIVFLFAQKKFVEGITLTGLKS